MPRPTPPYIPARLIEQAGDMSPKAYALTIGLHPHRFYSIFGGNHATFLPYCKLADLGGITLDELAKIIQARKVSAWLQTLRAPDQRPFENLHQVAKAMGHNDDWLRNLSLDDGQLKALKEYHEVATALGWNLDEMRDCCGLTKTAA